MSQNTFGHLYKIHSFGESHGVALGAVIEGCPAGVTIDEALLNSELARRRPGVLSGPGRGVVSPRQELDIPEILSGVFEGRSLGTPIAVIVKNSNQKSDDYKNIKNNPRAGHADDVWKNKFSHSDYRGGGRSSGRETLSRVIGGAVAQMCLNKVVPELRIRGFVSQLGPHQLTETEISSFINSQKNCDEYSLRFPAENRESIKSELLALKEKGDSWGGCVQIAIQNPPAGLGQPVFKKLKSELGAALLSVGAVSAVEIGEVLNRSSETGVQIHKESVNSKYYGGIRGGISTGETINLKAFFKPTSSILDVAKQGRHDPAILLRAVPVLEAMVKMVIFDQLLWKRLDQI